MCTRPKDRPFEFFPDVNYVSYLTIVMSSIKCIKENAEETIRLIHQLSKSRYICIGVIFGYDHCGTSAEHLWMWLKHVI
jgi:hypothetical protein